MNATNRWTHDLSNTWIAALVFLVSIAVYTITLTPTVPFWDAGEYIATSFILGIPHPPGTPLYVLIGRIFTMLPIGTVAQQVNWLSALASSITILFTYLITVKMTRSVYKPEEGENHKVLSYVAGIVAAFIAAFATTFWDNAIEAEVYAGACAIMTFCIWLIMRWQERLDEGTEDGLLLLITYIVGIGVGIHLQVAIAAWPAVIFVFVCRPHYLKQWNYLGWAIVTLSLGIGINGLTFLWAPFVLVVTLIMWLLSGRLHRLAFFSSVLFILGLSVHFYLMIRSNLNPVINEGAPGNWQALWEMLIRDQYKPGSPFDRKAPVWYQIDHMWLRYMMWNFTLYGSKLTALIPLAIGAVGAVVQFMRDKKQSAITFALFGLLGPGMVFYMNFRQGEVRERDYFFVQNFQFMSIWIGIGSAFVLHWLSKNFGGKKSMTAILGALFVMMALLPLAHNWRSHDRRGYVLAENYAHNMLMGCEEGAILFTNGDNDTFPLWYLQEVEGVRKDVRVVNLSLLNTPWYIKQLRDLDPQLPIVWTDGQIESIYIALEYVIASATAQGRQVRIPTEVSQHWDNESLQYILESLRAIGADPGRDVSVRELAGDQIIRENEWKKPIYIATSVPDVMGLGSQLKFEGLV
ncbi:MAG: DUF2723 domain-containing protein, partial [Candidatus Eisenbacteria bacterium]|nr:DUF2723 domain-containing protein [Candidatus Eisenbacteria bacterium]